MTRKEGRKTDEWNSLEDNEQSATKRKEISGLSTVADKQTDVSSANPEFAT